MGLLPEIQHRSSVREFSSRPVDPSQLSRILEAGRLAPSAKNRQAWRFIVIQDEEIRATIRDAAFGQEYLAQAPVVIALCTTNIEYKMPNGQLSYPVDLSIAASFMMLQAVHEGLGTCLVTTFREEDVKSVLTVPYSMRVVTLVAIGHAADGAAGDGARPVDAGHKTRLPLDRIVSYDHW